MKATTKIFIACLALGLGACGLMDFLGLGGSSRLFSHRLHVGDEGLECVVCHRTVAQADEAGMPSMSACMKCHKGIDEERPPEKKLAALYGEEPAWSAEAALSEEVIFSHKAHLDAKVACDTCHGDIGKSEGITGDVRVSKAACLACHEKEGRVEGCEACHRVIRKNVPPGNHRKNWKRIHGTIVRAGSDAPADQCSLCHSESSCTTCHQDEPPMDHNNFWRYQGHAVASGVDRSRCETCHRSDFCDRCHRETAPRNHVGAWGGTQNRHCLFCHGASSFTQPSCGTCHLRANHPTSPRRPANPQHALSSPDDCRTCHLIIGLPHIDNGDSCIQCH